MKTRVHDICSFLEEIAPLGLQESYDNAGLLVGDPNQVVSGVLVCLDALEEVIDEAISLNANLVVAHHPIIFSGLKSITGRHYIERVIIKAIKNDIAIYAIHTNLDSVLFNGVNETIAQKIGLKELKILSEKVYSESEKYGGVGAGIIGSLEVAEDEEPFMERLKNIMECKMIRHTRYLARPIQRVAICGGSGSFLLADAIEQGADIFISADFKYHQFFDANDQLIIADIGHYESEHYTTSLLHNLIIDKFSTFAAHYSKVNTNPINYL